MKAPWLPCLLCLLACDPRSLGSFGREMGQAPALDPRDAGSSELDAASGRDSGLPADRDAAVGALDAALPDGSADASLPDASLPDGSLADASLADASLVDGSLPDGSVFECDPAAAERCDGRDNDCDGLLDLHEGLPLSGVSRDLDVGRDPVVVAAGDRFGVVYARAGAVWFRSIDAAGNGQGGALRIDEPAETSPLGTVALAFSGGTFAVAWGRDDGVRFRLVDARGAALGAVHHFEPPTHEVPRRVRVGRMEGGDWLLLYEHGPARLDRLPAIVGRRITAANESLPLQFELARGATSELALVTAPDFVRVAWLWESEPFEGMPRPQSWMVLQYLTATLTRPGDPFHEAFRPVNQAPGTLAGLVLATSPQGYAFAWADRLAGHDRLSFMQHDPDSLTRCIPAWMHSTPGNEDIQLLPRAMVGGQHRYLIAGSRGDVLELVEVVLDDLETGERVCRYSQRATVAEAPHEEVAMAQLASGKLLVVWEERRPPGDSVVMQRLLGPHLCAP
jgi:hypothetical protein